MVYNYEHVKVGDIIILDNIGIWGKMSSVVTRIDVHNKNIRFKRDDGDCASIRYPSDTYNIIIIKSQSKSYNTLINI